VRDLCVSNSRSVGASYHLVMRRAAIRAALTLVAAALLALGLVDAAWFARSVDRGSSGALQEAVLDAPQREHPVVHLHAALGIERIVAPASPSSVRGLAAVAGVTAILAAACVVRRLAADDRVGLVRLANSRHATRAPPAFATT
jgi:hypothetical protein